jgi:hypothetical protein
MNRNKFIVIGLLCLLVATQLMPLPTTNANLLEVSTDDIYVKGGQENTIKVSLRNIGGLNITNAVVTLSSQTPGIVVTSEAQRVYQSITEKTTKTFYPTIYVDQSVPLGTYSLMLNVNYIRYGTMFDTTISMPIGIIVSENYIPKLRYISDQNLISAKSGVENTVTYKFENRFTEELKDVNFVLTSRTQSISIIDESVKSVNSLMPGEQVNVSPRLAILEGTPLGTYTINVAASFKDSNDRQFYESYTVPINVASAEASRGTVITLKNITVLEGNVFPGDTFTLEMNIECDGADAYDLLSTLSFGPTASISPISPTIISLGDMASGETETLTYRLLASGNIPAGQYPVSTTVTYINSKGVPSSITETFIIMVNGIIEFELLDIPTVEVDQGSSNTIEADLLLIGTESVQFVSIDLNEDDVFKRVSGSTEYIGAVDPDSPIPFSIKYKVDGNATIGLHPMGFTVSYRDHLNKEHNVQLGFNANVNSSTNIVPQNQGSGLWFWIRRILGLGP